MQTLLISTKSIAQFLSNNSFKNGTQKRSFQYGKVALAVRTQKHQLQFVIKVAAVCTDTRAQSSTPLSNCSVSDVLVEATPLFDETLFQLVDVLRILLR